ncbi:retrotransposon protein, putative, ty1-copia subclass [Tanacetum coccineum]|uniref:Retrotransposon protein, putative, ty1-copia subclass n=1 Tax=Tanacetum coccineum TaxID=301880 RepID=A0ABQ5HRX3_9ASTR
MEVEDDVVGDLGEPANYKAAMFDPDKVIWQGAMDEEMNSMKVNEVWTEVDPPPNAKTRTEQVLFKKKNATLMNKRFDEEIKKFGFTQNRDEPCVYRKASGSNVVILQILYVDDILIMGNNIPRLKEVKDYLGKCFSMKDIGEVAYILGIKIYRDISKRLTCLEYYFRH